MFKNTSYLYNFSLELFCSIDSMLMVLPKAQFLHKTIFIQSIFRSNCSVTNLFDRLFSRLPGLKFDKKSVQPEPQSCNLLLQLVNEINFKP